MAVVPVLVGASPDVQFDVAPPSLKSPSFRIPWVDYVKGMCITWVVFRHTASGLQDGAVIRTDTFLTIYAWLGEYSMGALFFMSGFFIRGAVHRPMKDFLYNRAMTIGYVYVLWVTLFWIFQTITGSFSNRDSSFVRVLDMLYTPPWHYWFIYALLLISIVYVCLRKLGLPDWAVVAIGIFLYFGEGLFGLVPWAGFHFLCRHMVLYTAGAWTGTDGVFARLSRAPSRVVVAVLAMALTVVVIGTLYNYKEMPVGRLVSFTAGFVVLACVGCLLQRAQLLRVLEYIGRHSLQIYVAHVFGTAGMRILLNTFLGIGEHHVVLHISLGLLAGVFGPIALTIVADRMNFPYLFTLLPNRKARKLASAPVAA